MGVGARCSVGAGAGEEVGTGVEPTVGTSVAVAEGNDVGASVGEGWESANGALAPALLLIAPTATTATSSRSRSAVVSKATLDQKGRRWMGAKAPVR